MINKLFFPLYRYEKHAEKLNGLFTVPVSGRTSIKVHFS